MPRATQIWVARIVSIDDCEVYLVEARRHGEKARQHSGSALQTKEVTGRLDENKLGGTPVFMQGDEFPFKGNCRLLLQLDSCSVPFYINFGDAGVGYAFLNDKADQAKFLWQCG